MQTTITVNGTQQALQRIGLIKQGVLQLAAPMEQIGKLLTGFYAGEVFASRGQVIGEPWAPLNAKYALRKATGNTKRNIGKGAYPGRGVLVRTGAMQNSFRFESGESFARIYNTATYFKYHQLGTRHIPQRVMMAIDDTRRRLIVGIIDRHIQSLLSK